MVFLSIAGARLIMDSMSATTTLGLSEHYRLVLPINLTLVVVTIAMNYLFLRCSNGALLAALATLGTFVWNNAKWYGSSPKFGVHPFTWSIPMMGNRRGFGLGLSLAGWVSRVASIVGQGCKERWLAPCVLPRATPLDTFRNFGPG